MSQRFRGGHASVFIDAHNIDLLVPIRLIPKNTKQKVKLEHVHLNFLYMYLITRIVIKVVEYLSRRHEIMYVVLLMEY